MRVVRKGRCYYVSQGNLRGFACIRVHTKEIWSGEEEHAAGQSLCMGYVGY